MAAHPPPHPLPDQRPRLKLVIPPQRTSRRYRFPSLGHDRTFDPKPWYQYGPQNQEDILTSLIDYNQWTRHCNLASFTSPTARKVYQDSLLVYTSGSCRTVFGEKIAAAGICFGSSNSKNVSMIVRREYGIVEGPVRQVNKEIAAFKAAETALNVLRPIEQGKRAGTIGLIVVTTDSEYLMRVITNWVHEWGKNGWLDSNGQPVNIKEEAETLHQQVRFFENRGVIVKFWKLDEALNKDARLLAENAMNIMAMESVQVVENHVEEKISKVDQKRKQIDMQREKLEEQRKKIEFEKEAMREIKQTQLRLEKEWEQRSENERIKVEKEDFEMLFGQNYQFSSNTELELQDIDIDMEWESMDCT